MLELRGSLGVARAVSERVTVALGAGYGGGIALLRLYVTDWFSIDTYAF